MCLFWKETESLKLKEDPETERFLLKYGFPVA